MEIIMGFLLFLELSEPVSQKIILPFAKLIAKVSSRLLNLLGLGTVSTSTLITSPQFTVDIDTGHGADDIVAYREQQGATWTFGVDVEGKNEAYGVGPVPAAFIVDRNGYIVKVFTGAINATTLDGYFEEVVSASEEGAGDDKAEDLGDVLAHPFVQFLVLVLVISLAGVGWLMTVNTRLKGRLKEVKREKRKERLSDRPRKKKWD
jgi:hypothetical protein